MKNDQGLWNFIFSALFVVLLVLSIWILYTLGRLPTAIPFFDIVLISLATFRLTRLFVYDFVTQFVRDLFLDTELMQTAEGKVVLVRTKPSGGSRRTIIDLLSCPWCFGVWAALVVIFAYFLTPFAWFVILVLAVAGVASFIQILVNMIGWRAEHLKKKAQD